MRFVFLLAVASLGIGCAALAQTVPSESTALEDVPVKSDQLRVHFIDVGPGMAVLIETPNDRRNIFIDGCGQL